MIEDLLTVHESTLGTTVLTQQEVDAIYKILASQNMSLGEVNSAFESLVNMKTGANIFDLFMQGRFNCMIKDGMLGLSVKEEFEDIFEIEGVH